MKIVISLLIIVGVLVGGYKLWDYWDRVEQEKERQKIVTDGSNIDPSNLQGMPNQILIRYNEIKDKGVDPLRQFLEVHDKFPSFKDPRKAWIELDYIVLISSTDPLRAKRMFADIKERVSTNSVIYPRIRSMAKNYE